MGNTLPASKVSSLSNPLPPKIGDVVNTQFGPGKIEDYREEDNVFVVCLRWELAEGKRAYACLQPDSLSKRQNPNKPQEETPELYAPGTLVDTPQGRAVVTGYRVRDGMYVVEYENWLTDGQVARGFLNPGSVKHHVRAKRGKFVSTVYGTGVVAQVRRDGIHVVKIKQNEGAATAYLQADAILGPIKAYVSSTVHTPFGQGVVIAYRPSDDVYEVQLDFAVAFLNAESIDFLGYRASTISPEAAAAGLASPTTPSSHERQGSCSVS